MKQKCTIFCTTGTADNFLKIANEISARKISKEGDNHDWSSLVYRMEDTRMTINRMDKSAPDNGLAQVIEATQTLVKKIKTDHSENQNALVDSLSKCEQLLAVTVEPVFDVISEEIVYSILEASDGVLFTGHDFLDQEGCLILDMDGIVE